MGDRYFLTVTCPKCIFLDDDVYYAPTCEGFTEWECPSCGHIIDLAEYTGISKEDASNKAEIEEICKIWDKNRKE
jgi:ribosomal protein S27E